MNIKASYSSGSVLMEFIIVLPLYLALFGMVFLYGDASLHAVNMAASGDRALAVSHGMTHDGRSWNESAAMPFVAGALSLSSNEVVTNSKYYDVASDKPIEANASEFSNDTHGAVADPSFNGSWTWLVGSVLSDDYALSPVSRSFVRAWKVFADAARMSDSDWEKDREYASDSVLGRLFPNRAKETYSIGRIKGMVSKDLEGSGGEVRAYAYYTLMRNGKGRTSYRNWTSSEQIGGFLSEGGTVWDKYVYQEPYFFDKADDGTERNYDHLKTGTESSGGGSATCFKRALYQRYGSFVTWSE